MQKIPKFHIPEAFKSQVNLQPNPHANHEFDGDVAHTFVIDGYGSTRSVTHVEDALLEYLSKFPDPKSLMETQKKPDAKYAIGRTTIGEELIALRIYNILDDGTYKYNDELSTIFNRASGHKSSIQTMMFLNLLQQSIILEP